QQLLKTDRNGNLAKVMPFIVNWILSCKNKFSRYLLEKLFGIHKDAALPLYFGRTFEKLSNSFKNQVFESNTRKAVLYTTCFVNYNNPSIGEAAKNVLSKNGVEVKTVYPSCCGMPQLEQGDIGAVAKGAQEISKELLQWVDRGYDVIALVPSCSLMLKFEWPLILPDDDNILKLSNSTYDICEYLVNMSKNEGLSEGLKRLEGDITLHLSCHSRAQNMGPQAAELLKLIPDTNIEVIERCSGHGGSWGITKENFEVALKVGLPVARKANQNKYNVIVSECPLAREHIIQGVERLDDNFDSLGVIPAQHPIQLIAKAYGF
ncbi:MAG: heterodisulfide reductase-related iron-sulfur binding cluster, partial [Pseudomonadota bacterium]|nr:heterodisulfide reductase-related iron-sulfur binding cluster [Pseudomonadota bacterium]